MTENLTDLIGWSNLTKAIKEKPASINWENLEGATVRITCEKPQLFLQFELTRDDLYGKNSPNGWVIKHDLKNDWDLPLEEGLAPAIYCAWHGEHDLAMYIKGEIPTKPITADILPDKALFRGCHLNDTNSDVLLMKSGDKCYYVLEGRLSIYPRIVGKC